jgi:hypothetical protein
VESRKVKDVLVCTLSATPGELEAFAQEVRELPVDLPPRAILDVSSRVGEHKLTQEEILVLVNISQYVKDRNGSFILFDPTGEVWKLLNQLRSSDQLMILSSLDGALAFVRI